MLTSRIGHQTLSVLCERVGVAFDVGLDPHRVFDREAGKSQSTYARKLRSVAEHVRQGGSLADAIKAQGNYFPSHFGEMLDAGERTGRLDRVLDRMANYYQDLAEFRSIFMNSILWPMVQLVLATIVIGLLIYLPSVLLPGDVGERDLLGFGLVGERGLVIYLTIIAGIAFAIFVLYLLGRAGYFRFLADWFTYVPKLGRTVAVFPEARFVQTFSLGIEAGMDAWSAVDLAFRSAGTPRFMRSAEGCKDAIRQGRDMRSVLGGTGLFQDETLEAVQLGEESGRLAETLDKHFRHLKAQVKSSMAKVTYFASAVIWIVISATLITIIFRVFSLYIGSIGETVEATVNARGMP